MKSEIRPIQSIKKSHSIGIPAPILVTFMFYIGSLTITQTVYGLPFLTLRWFALGTFTLVSFIYWLFGRIPRTGRTGYRGDPGIVFIYLGATLLSVATAENYQFSGLRWMTQAMMIVCCMVFLRGTFNTERITDLLLPLKILSLLLLFVSILFPTRSGIYDNPYLRGAMGDSNSLGHVSAICSLVYLQGAITSRSRIWKPIQVAVAALAVTMLLYTGARSSMAAFVAGLVLTNLYSGSFRSLLAKAALFLIAAVIFASPMLQSKALLFMTKEERKNEATAEMMIVEGYRKGGFLQSSVFATRERLWSEAWEGFKRRPLLGWGFGANSDIPKEWSIKPTAIGFTRDITNDMLFILEGSGLIGFVAYLGLIISILRQSPTRQESLWIRSGFRRKKGPSSTPGDAKVSVSEKRPGLWQDEGRPGKGEVGNTLDELTLSKACVHVQMYTLSVSLFVLFIFDGSAFSAGSLISAIFWISAGAANLARLEAVASERSDRRAVNGVKNSKGQGFK